jgi:hypothetical protein
MAWHWFYSSPVLRVWLRPSNSKNHPLLWFRYIS